MIAALATLLFAATLWLVFLLALRMFDESWAKMVSAIRAEGLSRDPSSHSVQAIASARQQPQPRVAAAA